MKTKKTEPQRLYTHEDVGRAVGRTGWNVIMWVRRGWLPSPSVSVGSKKLFTYDEFMHAVEAMKVRKIRGRKPRKHKGE